MAAAFPELPALHRLAMFSKELRDRIQSTEEWIVNRQLAVAEKMR